MSVQTQALLKASYQDAKSLIEFTKQVRTKENDFSGKYSVKQAHLDHLFSPAVWSAQKTKTGHRKLIHKVTGIVINYGNHKKQIDPGAVLTVFELVQKHLNILCNDIFVYKMNNWKKKPDYVASAKRIENFDI